MEKYIVKALLCSTLALPALTSCELDQYPETSLPTEQSWKTMSDADNYNIGLLSQVRGISTRYGVLSDIQTDMFNLVNTATDYVQEHCWSFTDAQFDGDGLWSGNYGAISNANNVINNIDKVQVAAGSDDAKTLRYYKGLAYFCRAYAYDNMVTRYCKDYDAATAAETPGLPIVLTVDVNAKPSRASLYDTFKQIRADIDSAKAMMADPTNLDYTAPHYNTAVALEARVSLQMRDYDNAISAADKVLEHYSLFTSKSDYQTMWESDEAEEGTEIIYEPQLTQDEQASYYGLFISYDESSECYNPAYVPTQGLYELYTARGDYRRNIFFARNTQLVGGTVYATGTMFNKFPGNEALRKSSQGNVFMNMCKAFRTAELYLIAAEASYLKDGSGASYLNVLRKARGMNETAVSGDLLFNEIKNEWIREFCGEGFRLDCLKRWHEGFTRMEAQSLTAGYISTQEGSNGLTVEADNYRFVWEIPTNDLQANKNLTRNWATN